MFALAKNVSKFLLELSID